MKATNFIVSNTKCINQRLNSLSLVSRATGGKCICKATNMTVGKNGKVVQYTSLAWPEKKSNDNLRKRQLGRFEI